MQPRIDTLRAEQQPGVSRRAADAPARIATYFHQPCTACGRTLRVHVELLGINVVCQHCGRRLTALDADGQGEPLQADGVLKRADELLAMLRKRNRKRTSDGDGGKKQNNQRLVQQVWQALQAREPQGLRRVHVEAEDGFVILRGRVPSGRLRLLCVRTCRGLPGVTRVINLLEVGNEPARTGNRRA